MGRRILVGTLLIAIGAAAGAFAVRSRPAGEAAHDVVQRHAVPMSAGHDGSAATALGDRSAADLERRLRTLEARVAAEASARARLAERCEAVAAQLAAPGSESPQLASASEPAQHPPAAAEGPADGAAGTVAAEPSISPMERALAAAGLDTAAAAEIKQRRDQLMMSEMYLRDQATREQWIDSPRFNEEMAALDAQRTSIRDEIGDDSYDRYLFALGEPNRVRVDDVMAESPAAEAGLQVGDVIVSYADSRIFAPDELVTQTRSGTAGESVRVEVMRNGERLAIDVPRGPLGLRIAASQAAPGTS